MLEDKRENKEKLLRKLYLTLIYYKKVYKEDFEGNLTEYEELLGFPFHPSHSRGFLKELINESVLVESGVARNKRGGKDFILFKADMKLFERVVHNNLLYRLDYMIVDNEVSIIRPPIIDGEERRELENMYMYSDIQRLMQKKKNR